MQRNPVDGEKLICRRGQPFKIRLHLNRPYVRSQDAISFLFTLADDDKPSLGHGSLIGCPLRYNSYELGDPLEWGSAIDAINGDVLTVLIKPAATAAIGEWRVDVDTQLQQGNGMKSFKYPSTFYVLFNPWCKDDQVYLADADQLEEYILADTTLVWRGSYNRLRPSIWKLGQYEKNVLDCSLLLISAIGKVMMISANAVQLQQT